MIVVELDETELTRMIEDCELLVRLAELIEDELLEELTELLETIDFEEDWFPML